MQQHLYKFLVLHHSLTLPQLASFIIEEQPARLDVTSHLLFAPKPVIHFGETAAPLSDKFFFNFLAEEMDVDETTAIKEFQAFCSQMRKTIQEDNVAVLPGIGRVMKGPDDTLCFTPETSLFELLPPIPWNESSAISRKAVNELTKQPDKASAEQHQEIVEEEIVTEETTIPSDRWWLYALILLISGAIALLFYYQ